ncbi:hypothetical protein PIROE2DRAFT_63060 [Piromyces sp. E2]|nr:hypothetical protein PIROE2DRAFT_63060 [Piromyces sp. E2]|eukprot:OUM60561.1 hypothetical protein PIROE2DRAFT_63060 [Piromyces sp. E2]
MVINSPTSQEKVPEKKPVRINSNSSTISLQNDPNNNKNKLTSKGEDSGSVLQPVLVPQLNYSTIQNILDINKKLIKVLIEYQNYGWIEDPDFIIYQRRLQTNLNYLATVADNYLNFNKISIPDLSPVTLTNKLKIRLEEKENEKQKLNHTKDTPITTSTTTTTKVKVMKYNHDMIPATTNTISTNTTTTTTSSSINSNSSLLQKIKKEEGKEVGEGRKSLKVGGGEGGEGEGEESRGEDSDEKDTVLSSFEDILPSLPPPYFISDPNIYDHTELDNVSPIDPGSYVATQPFVIPEQVKRPPAVDKSKDVGYLTPGVTRAIFKGRWEGITLGGGGNNNNNNNSNSTN